jgi:two-component system, sensor histidine kinase and response regulator
MNSKQEKTASLLIVDDEPSARSTIEALLYVEGYRLILAGSAEEAFDLLEKESPDAILMDLMMPGMDGIKACMHIKNQNRFSHIPIILVTALDSKECLKEALSAGADDFIAKPVNGMELRARTRSMLRIKSQYDRLQRIIELREDMANMVVHDMRSPLTSILGYAELIRKSLDQQGQSDLKKIIAEAKRVNSYLDDLLLMAKMESEELILNKTPSDIFNLVRQAAGRHEMMARARSIHIETRFPDRSVFHIIDYNMISKVVDNLVSNALKYSDENTAVIIEVHKALAESGSGRPKLNIIIRDEGLGIPEDKRELIFSKYNIVEMKKKGLRQIGLGLAFCKLAVEAHGGRIWVEENKPRGSVFRFEI